MATGPMSTSITQRPGIKAGSPVRITVPWKRCAYCTNHNFSFKSPREFVMHLRDFHCTKEGGSFVCRYGPNGICPSLPLEGVSDRDYEDHIARFHVASVADVSKLSSRLPPGGSASSSRSTSPCLVPSTEPSVVQDQHRWTIYQARVNMPALLNDPRLVRRETDIFSKTWGESFERATVIPSHHIPHITREHFRRYLKKTSKRFQDHRRISSPPSDESDSTEDALPGLKARTYDKYRAELDAIPKIFMHPAFSLENTDTFNAVFPWTQVESSHNEQTGKTKQSSKLLQEKLSHYLDLVEVQIAKQISTRSEAFFEAMASQDELQHHMKKTCAAIKHLRDKLHQVNDSTVEGPLKIMQLSRSRSNHVSVYNKLKLMSTVHQTQPMIQQLLATNDFVGALDLIGTTHEVLTQELAGVLSFRHLGSQLIEMEKVIDKMLQEEFVRYATADLNRPLSDSDLIMEEHLSDDCDVFGVPIELSDNQEKLVAIVLGMLRQHKYNFIDVYREESSTTLKAIVKQTVIENIVDIEDIDSEIGSLADQMRLLGYTQWMDMLHSVFENLLGLLRRVKAVSCVMHEVVRIAGGPMRLDSAAEDSDVLFEQNEDGSTFHKSLSENSSIRMSVSSEVDFMISHTEFVKANTSLRDMLCQVCDHAHDRCVKILVARSKDGFLEKLSSTEFVLLSRSIEGFVSNCELICGRKSTSLRACLQSQASRFVNRFHEERKTKLSLILDNERWKQADVPTEFQDLIDYIDQSGKLNVPDKKVNHDKKPQEFLIIEGESYAVVGTVLMLLKMVVEYCHCVEDIPTATPDILARLIELLKMFNSRTCQLILGAGALQLVGLKTITTKNLALASRCLQVVVHYIPRVRRHFEERLQAKNGTMVKHFDSVLKDYNDHITELANKLVFIMDNMLEANLARWEVKAPMPSTSFRNIGKQMTKLYEAVTDLLPEDQILHIFRQIDSNFRVMMRSQLIRLGVTNDGGPQHALVMADINHYTTCWRSVPALHVIPLQLSDIWDKR